LSGPPTILGTTIPVPTMTIQFEQLNVEFLVDSNLANWKSIYSWIITIMKNKCIDEVRKNKNVIKVDVTDNLFVPEFDFDTELALLKV
jgi:uncharacterized ubiquitin-like protein YukD